MNRQFLIKFTSSFLIVCLIVALAGCGGYALRGKVVRGEVSTFELVHKLDKRLQQPGISQAEVMIKRDPDTLNQYTAGRDRTGPDGYFSLSIDAFGAGWMEEEWLMQCILRGYQNAEEMMELPPKDSPWRLLITLAPGPSMSPDRQWDYREDVERFR